MEETKKYTWQKLYTWVLVANAFYVVIFYLIMKLFS